MSERDNSSKFVFHQQDRPRTRKKRSSKRSESQSASSSKESSSRGLKWSVIFLAYLVTFFWLLALGISVGILIVVLTFFLGNWTDDLIVRVLGLGISILLQFYAVVKGVEYIRHHIGLGLNRHCWAYGATVVIIDALMLLVSSDSETGLTDWLAILLTIPFVLITLRFNK